MIAPPETDWPKGGLETLGACPVCERTQRSVLHDRMRDTVYCCAPGLWTLWRCKNCHSAYLDPRPTAATIHLAYTKYHTHTLPDVPEPQKFADLSVPYKVRRALANGYRNWRYGTEYSPSSRLGIPAAFALPMFRRTIDRPLRHLPHPAATGGRRVLDIGFGSGAYMDLVTSMGWEAFGCDPDPIAVENARARGLSVRTGGVEVWADAEETFDAVTLRHVVEHLHDPVSALRSIFRLLRPGGQFFLDAPNIDSLGHQHYGRYWVGLDPPRHLVLLNWETTNQLLAKLGFCGIRRRTYPVMNSFGLASAKMAAGFSPFGKVGSVDGPGLSLRLRARLAHSRSEFITLTCRKPK